MTAKSDEARAADASRPDAAPTPSGADEFEALFLEHWPRVYGLLVRLVGDHAEAEDLALETFWRLHNRLSADGRALNLGGWLYRVATNLGFNALRGWKRREQYELEAGHWDPPQPPVDPAEALAQAEERQRVRQVLKAMNPRQAQLLILRHSGLSYRELAAALDVSANSIGVLLARAEREFEERYAQAT